MKAASIVVAVMAATAGAGGQSAETADPIRCWWRTSVGAIAVGEPFDATLTCAVREQESVRTVPDESRLAAAVIQLSPFELLGGSHPDDLRTATHRFFQYHYTLRVIDSDAIGRDAKVPDIQIAYRVHTRVNGEWVEGRDRAYIMPGQSMRVLSLVPVDADDIRDSTAENFAHVTGLRFRARALEIAAVAVVLLGVLVALPAVALLLRRGGRADTPGEGKVPRRLVLAAARNELAEVARQSRGGWTPDLTARALNAIRLVASCALKRDVGHQPPTGQSPSSGRVKTTLGLIQRRQASISSALTPVDVQKAMDALPLTARHEHRQLLQELLQAMTALTVALYAASFNAQDPALDRAVATATAAARRLRGGA